MLKNYLHRTSCHSLVGQPTRQSCVFPGIQASLLVNLSDYGAGQNKCVCQSCEVPALSLVHVTPFIQWTCAQDESVEP